MNPHDLLGVREGCGLSEVRDRYKKVCKMYHPDRHDQDPTSVHVFQCIQDAYGNLKRVTKKARSEHAGGEVESRPAVATEESTKRGVLGHVNKDPYFHQEFSLCDMFHDVGVPDRRTGLRGS